MVTGTQRRDAATNAQNTGHGCRCYMCKEVKIKGVLPSIIMSMVNSYAPCGWNIYLTHATDKDFVNKCKYRWGLILDIKDFARDI